MYGAVFRGEDEFYWHIAADIRIRQIAVVRTITAVISVICSILIASGMISSTATIGCENNAD
jgi:hypothetical protein